MEGPVLSDSLRAELFLLDVVSFALLIEAGIVQPRVEADMEVHLQQEGVARLSLTDHFAEELLVDLLAVGVHALGQGDLVNLVLGFQFASHHFSIEPERAVETPHTPVQKLIEIDIAIVTSNCHLEQYLFHLVVWRVCW